MGIADLTDTVAAEADDIMHRAMQNIELLNPIIDSLPQSQTSPLQEQLPSMQLDSLEFCQPYAEQPYQKSLQGNAETVVGNYF